MMIAAVTIAMALAQAPPQEKIDKAIDSGCAFLISHLNGYLTEYEFAGHGNQSDAPLVLHALVKGKADPSRPEFKKALQYCLSHDLERTYFAAVTALALEALDMKKYAGRIGQCAQFLMDNQCKNGQWDYRLPVRLPIASLMRPSGSDKPGSTIAGKFSLENNFVPRENQRSWQYYHLYSLERAGNLTDTVKFGTHDWYGAGATYLLDRLQGDGHWDAPDGIKKTVWDTCFAILFLARATRPVASQDLGAPSK